ncbi:vitamin B12-dependent ribonucleotide reductase [bacterium]|nr:vitamin B12-dependent ribonucleotide reductase [bacterium]
MSSPEKTDTLFSEIPEKDNGNGTHVADEIKVEKKPKRIIKTTSLEQLPDPRLSENALTVLKRRYLKKDTEGNVTETPKVMFWRVATAIAEAEKSFENGQNTNEVAVDFYRTMAALDFIPNSPTLMNAGRQLGQLSACFVLPIEDSMEAIFEAVKNAALVHKSGGGTGFSFSKLRPKASMVMSTAGTASGPVSFMSVFNAATETIKQGGTRRGANMGILRIDHPDIREFITCKKDMVSITNFNISVAVTDVFLHALEQDEKYDLIDPSNGEVARKESAREIFDLITNNAWLNGDPGVIFIDEINRCNPTPNVGEIEATNPCGEQPLLAYESCNLGSINLDNMVTDGEIDWDHLRRTVRVAVRFLDNVIEVNKYALESIKNMTRGNRKIGLGIMGFADMLYALGIPYDSEEALGIGRKVMQFVDNEGKRYSEELADERGPFPNWEDSVYERPIRNATVTTLAPTGTISMIADTSGGVEPNFALVYVKRVMDDDKLLYVNKRFEEAAKAGGFYSRELMEKIAEGSHLADLDEIPADEKKVFATAHDITPEWHIRMQAAFQESCDNAVSKTINFPNSATVKDVEDAYLLSWKLKCKGVTIYRDGSRNAQVMNVGDALVKSQAKIRELETKSEAESTVIKAVSGAPSDEENIRLHSDNSVRNKSGYLKPRERPRITFGMTEQINTGDGTMYVTINSDKEGLCEVFASLGKSGGNAAAQSEAIGRLISLAIRSGIDPRQIVKQLKGISGSNPIWHEGEMIKSTPDAIGRVLERYLDREQKRQTSLPLEEMTEEEQNAPVEKAPVNKKPGIEFVYGVQVKEMCPDCQSPVIFEEGCLICRQCGYSKCE